MGLTERQQKWFASVEEGLQRETGRSLAEWVELARACPESAHRKRLAWMKAEHGLGQNRASLVLGAAFPPERGWSEPDALAAALWKDAAARAVFYAVRARAEALPGTVVGQRKGYTAFSRATQYAAAKPARAGLVLGLALPPGDARQPAGLDGWSERLLSRLVLADAGAVDDAVGAQLRQAWERS